MTQSPASPARPDWPTLIAVSALAYILEVALREHLGHAAACIWLGGHPTELSAFYVECDYTGMSDLAVRLVAFFGPLVSLLTGVTSFFSLSRLPPHKPVLYYFVWLLGTIGLMTATGYLLFSGVSGIGDLSLTRDGMFYGASPAWLWQIILSVAGAASYFAIIRLAVYKVAPRIGGVGRARITYARHLVLASYLTGAVLYIAIGLLNSVGLMIVLISSAASSLRGTSGFLWMMQLLGPKQTASANALAFQRKWGWIILGAVVTAVYAFVLGPTVRL